VRARLNRNRPVFSRLADATSRAAARLVGPLARALVWAVRRFSPDRCAEVFGALARRIGPWLGVSKLGRQQLRAAYPEKTDLEIEVMLAGVWDNLGRWVAETLHIDRLWDWDILRPYDSRMVGDGVEKLLELRDDGKPSLVFACHIGNWEIAAVAAAALGADFAVLFRPPNNPLAAEIIHELRRTTMGRLIPANRVAPVALASELARGAHVGMLVDQFAHHGTPVTFFGRACPANPTIARLARHFECEVRGVRAIRLPGTRFRLELTDPLDLPRDADGKIDIDASMQMIISIVEGWIRETPEQWLWLHRRWRDSWRPPRSVSGRSSRASKHV
jgi:KDO2-lipid IV(A) lauroyltransferase